MIEALQGNRFMVEEQGGWLRSRFAFNVLDPASGVVLLQCREGTIGLVTRLFRLTNYRGATPFDLQVNLAGGARLMRIRRGIPVTASRVQVLDGEDVRIGGFHQRRWSISGLFDVVDAMDQPVCLLRGRSRGREFHFLAPDGVLLARVTKRWAGLSKELFTSADHYLVEIEDVVPPDETLRQLILASAICVGLTLKIELP